MKIPDKINKFFISIFLFLIFISLSAPKTKANSNLWESVTSLPVQIASGGGFSNGNKIFIIGGAADTMVPFIYTTEIDNNNILNPWNVRSWQYSLLFDPVVSAKNKIYVLGGYNYPTTFVNNVRMATIDSQNNIDPNSWIEETPLPDKYALGSAIILSNHLYYIGGENNSGNVNPNIYVTNINNDGTIGTWNIAGQNPIGGITGSMVFGFKNKIVIAGGADKNSVRIPNVEIATIDDNGNISDWTTGPTLPLELYRAFTAQSGNTIFLIGGSTNPKPFPQESAYTYYATFDESGNLGSWIKANDNATLPDGNGACCGASAQVNNYIYLLGGYSSLGGYRSNVIRANINDLAPLTPQSSDLSVPNLKQTNSAWNTKEYDNAHLWSPNDFSIGSWGCALTSATMVLNYYGYNKLPDGTELNPDTLNAWLESQNDGYVDNNTNGYLNWLAITRLTKLAKSINNISSFDTLEYQRTNGLNNNKLTTDLKNNIPDILEEPGHYIVAKGINQETFDINDPYYDNNKLSDAYSNFYLSLGSYIPANSDLSYIMLISDPKLNIIVKDNQNNIIGDSFIQNGIISDQDAKNKQNPIQITYLPKPDNGNYQIEILSNQTSTYNLKIYLYDQNGNDKIINQYGITNSATPDLLKLNFNKTNINLSSESRKVTFDTIISDLKNGYKLNMVKKPAFNTLFHLITNAKKQKNKFIIKILLNTFITETNIFKRLKLITTDEFNILTSDINTLKSAF